LIRIIGKLGNNLQTKKALKFFKAFLYFACLMDAGFFIKALRNVCGNLRFL